MRKGNYQLHKKYETSVNFGSRDDQMMFYFFPNPNGPNVPFIIRIQTKWMLETMVKLSHNSLIGMDSTFNTNKYGLMLILNDSFETID